MTDHISTDTVVGRVAWFNARLAYGFIAVEGAGDVFVHATALADAGLPFIREGDRIEFKIMPDQKTGRPKAVNLKLL